MSPCHQSVPGHPQQAKQKHDDDDSSSSHNKITTTTTNNENNITTAMSKINATSRLSRTPPARPKNNTSNTNKQEVERAITRRRTGQANEIKVEVELLRHLAAAAVDGGKQQAVNIDRLASMMRKLNAAFDADTR